MHALKFIYIYIGKEVLLNSIIIKVTVIKSIRTDHKSESKKINVIFLKLFGFVLKIIKEKETNLCSFIFKFISI